ncbi:hypothetical protein [Streptomyces rubrogriseus]|uniref:Uncharacterized protein n=2 Tax=Streptomyces rubrogriseus TaxID=194673 RepID=A0A6G3TTT4_9ACTN|nr:hypothetical protein [Streptomyces rubrogriseus]NEC40140.1 hypothetical protein [Streptomyces rubrogriseus]
MSTARRRLGTGPSATTTSPAGPAPRLLPVERVEPGRLLEDVEHQAVVEQKGRRTLGPGIARELP